MFTIKVKEAHSAAGQCWNFAQDMLSSTVAFTPIVLKLTGGDCLVVVVGAIADMDQRQPARTRGARVVRLANRVSLA